LKTKVLKTQDVVQDQHELVNEIENANTLGYDESSENEEGETQEEDTMMMSLGCMIVNEVDENHPISTIPEHLQEFVHPSLQISVMHLALVVYNYCFKYGHGNKESIKKMIDLLQLVLPEGNKFPNTYHKFQKVSECTTFQTHLFN
jgi:hypothetical protein